MPSEKCSGELWPIYRAGSGVPAAGCHAVGRETHGRTEAFPLARRANQPRKQIVELFQGRPGWRLEPMTTPDTSLHYQCQGSGDRVGGRLRNL
jgi:hypothetical protein